MDMELDERLVRRELLSRDIKGKAAETSLHIRRTLDQSYFLNLKDTSQRDRDQVVYRATKWQGNLARVVMVDQLWLWILDERTFLFMSCNNSCLLLKGPNNHGQIRLSHPSRKGGDATSLIHLAYTRVFENALRGGTAKSCQPGTLVSTICLSVFFCANV